MTHIEYHVKFKHFLALTEEWFERNNVGKHDTIHALLFNVYDGVESKIKICKSMLEQEICMSCFQLNLDEARKVIQRYMIVEKEIKDFGALPFLKDEINKICIAIRKENLKNGNPDTCHRVVNTAYDILQNGDEELN